MRDNPVSQLENDDFFRPIISKVVFTTKLIPTHLHIGDREILLVMHGEFTTGKLKSSHLFHKLVVSCVKLEKQAQV